MGYTYCSKLSVDSDAVNNTTYNPLYGFPFAGFVDFSMGGANPFETSNDYLQRWDSDSGMTEPNKGTSMCSQTNNTCVKINDMYCSTASDFTYTVQAGFSGPGTNNKRFLSMAPLARNINADNRGLTFFMDMSKEIKTEYTMSLPYSPTTKKPACNLYFCAAGFCKSNIPYIGLEYMSRMITGDLDAADTDNYYTLYSSKDVRNSIFGASENSALSTYQNGSTFIETYEYPGKGRLFLSPYALYRDGGVWETWADVLADVYYQDNNSDCLAYKLCQSIINVINSITAEQLSNYDIYSYDENFWYITVNSGTYFNTYDTAKINSFFDLLHCGGIYYKHSDGTFQYQNGLHIHITLNNNSGNTSQLNVDIGGSNSCSIYNNSLSYYLNRGEKFSLGQSDYTTDAISSGKYFFVMRSITDTLLPSNTDLYTCDTTTTFLSKCNSNIKPHGLYNRMDLYPNTSGTMQFLNRRLTYSSYSGYDSSTFKPKTQSYQTNLYRNYIPAFTGTPTWSSSDLRLSNMGVIEEDVEIQFNGNLYVSEVTLVFEGTTITDLSEISTVTVGQISKKVKTEGIENSQGNTEFVFAFNANNSPAKIHSTEGKAANSNMNVYSVSAQQMLKYCSFPGYAAMTNTTFDAMYRLDRKSTYSSPSGSAAVNPEDSQMTFTKITGRIPVSISGSGIYKNDSTNVKLISAHVKLTDESSLNVYVYTLGISNSQGYPSPSGLLGWMTNSTQYKFVSPVRNTLTYNIWRPILGSMSGDIPRYSGSTYDSSLYNMGISSFTTGSADYTSKIGLDSSNNVICVGPNYNSGSASGGTLETFSTSNSAYATDLTFGRLTYDLGLQKSDGTMAATGTRGTSVGANSVFYSINKTPFSSGSKSIGAQLDNDSYIKYSLPEPHLNAMLVYDSVEFNRASAWTFMRAMPLQPGSAHAPHILIYKVEAWVTEAGSNIVDYASTNSMTFDNNSSTIYSGYVSSGNAIRTPHSGYLLCVKGINDAINDSYILNNCYLKVDDGGNTEDLNAVGTSFPIRDITGNEEFYGASGLTAKIFSNIENLEDSVDISNDDAIYNELFSKAKTQLTEEAKDGSSGAQIVVFAYCHPTLKTSSADSGDYHKVIYICVGFYNSRNEMIPINGTFGITYTVTPDGGTPTPYTKYMSLSQFFPKDSMIYLAGKNYKNSTENEADNKLAFVTNAIKTTYTALSGDGVNSNDVPDTSEIINIGPGSGMSYEIASTSKSNGYWGDVPVGNVTPGLTDSHYTGHYGILNRYSGKVSFVSGVPYTDYKAYTDSLQGKCLLKHEHICYFSNKTGVVTLL